MEYHNHGCYRKMTAVFFKKSIRKSFNFRMLGGWGVFYSPFSYENQSA